jgi:hypothetical protein
MAQVYEADPERTVRSPSTTVPFPRVILLTKYVYVPHANRRDGDVTDLATTRDILDRDKHTCVYCGRAGATTMDHVMPQSRGGGNTWENLAASCRSCNNAKGDRTPEEWCSRSAEHKRSECRHKLRWHPWRPDKTGYTQRVVWAGLENEMAPISSVTWCR